jgi:chromosome segregation ATPase
MHLSVPASKYGVRRVSLSDQRKNLVEKLRQVQEHIGELDKQQRATSREIVGLERQKNEAERRLEHIHEKKIELNKMSDALDDTENNWTSHGDMDRHRADMGHGSARTSWDARENCRRAHVQKRGEKGGVYRSNASEGRAQSRLVKIVEEPELPETL